MTYRIHCERLLSFLAVADTGHFRQAAAKLNLSQPPLTRRIQALEAELGIKLLERTTRRVALTPAGERLAARLRPCFSEIEAACNEARQQSHHDTPVVALGMTSALDPLAFPSQQTLTTMLDSQVTVIRESSRELLARLLDWEMERRLQLAFIGLPNEVPEGVVVRVIKREPQWVALPTSHPLAKVEKVDLKLLNETPLLWFARRGNPAYFDHCDRVFRLAGYHPPRREEPTDHHHLLAAVAAGEGAALIPESFLATRREGMVMRPLTEDWAALDLNVALAWRKDDTKAQHLARRLLAQFDGTAAT
jgi:DNA-binding transcriptional LysR family regulator